MTSSWRTPGVGLKETDGGLPPGGRRADDALGEAAEQREVQHGLHAVPADGVLADLLRQPVPADRERRGRASAELHRLPRGGRRRDDDPQQRAGGRDGPPVRQGERLFGAADVHADLPHVRRDQPVLFVMTITSLQVLVILGVAYLFGVHPITGLPGVAAIILIGLLFGVGLTAISMALAFSVKSHGDFFSMLGFLSLPMIFLSTALVPLAAMPKWMAVLAQLNPMTWAIDAVRPLILSGWAAALPKIGIVVIVMTVFDSICLFGAARAFRRTLG